MKKTTKSSLPWVKTSGGVPSGQASAGIRKWFLFFLFFSLQISSPIIFAGDGGLPLDGESNDPAVFLFNYLKSFQLGQGNNAFMTQTVIDDLTRGLGLAGTDLQVEVTILAQGKKQVYISLPTRIIIITIEFSNDDHIWRQTNIESTETKVRMPEDARRRVLDKIITRVVEGQDRAVTFKEFESARNFSEGSNHHSDYMPQGQEAHDIAEVLAVNFLEYFRWHYESLGFIMLHPEAIQAALTETIEKFQFTYFGGVLQRLYSTIHNLEGRLALIQTRLNDLRILTSQEAIQYGYITKDGYLTPQGLEVIRDVSNQLRGILWSIYMDMGELSNARGEWWTELDRFKEGEKGYLSGPKEFILHRGTRTLSGDLKHPRPVLVTPQRIYIESWMLHPIKVHYAQRVLAVLDSIQEFPELKFKVIDPEAGSREAATFNVSEVVSLPQFFVTPEILREKVSEIANSRFPSRKYMWGRRWVLGKGVWMGMWKQVRGQVRYREPVDVESGYYKGDVSTYVGGPSSGRGGRGAGADSEIRRLGGYDHVDMFEALPQGDGTLVLETPAQSVMRKIVEVPQRVLRGMGVIRSESLVEEIRPGRGEGRDWLRGKIHRGIKK